MEYRTYFVFVVNFIKDLIPGVLYYTVLGNKGYVKK